MRREIVKATIVLACAAFAANASAACKRETLMKLTDAYVKAQTTGKAAMVPLDKGAYYGENDNAMDIGKGVLAGPLKVDFTRSFFDTTQCAAFTELVAATDSHPYVILTRMEANKNGKKVTKMESVVTDAGDWVFGADKYLEFSKGEDWSEIPRDKRDTREVIQAAADAYLNGWGDAKVEVPHGTPCARLEGSMYTGTRDPAANSCNLRFGQEMNVTQRRYVIDENYGLVVVFHKFPFLDGGLPKDPGTPAGQMFRVEGGKNRYIHEVTVCTTPGCGRAQRGGGPGAGGARRGGGPGGPGAGPGRQGGPGGPGPGPGAGPAAPAGQ
jgi:hypothetical protein